MSLRDWLLPGALVVLVGGALVSQWLGREVEPVDPPEVAVSASEAHAAQADLAATGGKPNVVFIMGCTVRRDQLSPYGAPASVTPYLDSVAKIGAVFDDAVGAAPWTRPASAALLTGRHPVSFGFVGDQRHANNRMGDDVELAAEFFQDAGYLTLGFTANPNLDPVFGFGQGFDAYQEGLRAFWTTDQRLGGTDLVDAALDSLERRLDRSRPFYLQLMLLDAHAPRTPTPSELAVFEDDAIPESVEVYRATLHQLDASIAYLAGELSRRGFNTSNTVFVFVADHGEGLFFPAHHGENHGRYLVPSVVRIPWLVWGVGVLPGHEIKGVASGVDVLPTVLSLAGVSTRGSDIVGRDWSAQVMGTFERTRRERAYVDSWFRDVSRAAVYESGYQCQRDFGSRRNDPLFEDACFDRLFDPDHRDPIRRKVLMRELVGWREARVAELAQAEVESVVPDEELTKHLKALGYVD